ncbi:cytochrome c/FTR1 family iron permease [Thermomonas sp.]|uniref:cytochrome c/FTR1 family iron permease n=1 Tax=Thermomonas sp. TaxID=1971895 RepID=UPI002B9385BA|nr:cytochrome c/FTR1 family iron permease [Thermomonas sp.]HRO62706.1 cytochrome c/FTR1 family iron permease [Thermomonas sp.]
MAQSFLRRFAFILLLLASGLAAAAAPGPEAEVRQAWQLLDYIAVDYAGAVQGGKVISAGEYAEMREFSATARERIAALPGNSKQADLLGQADALIALVERKAADADVARNAHALATDLLAAYGVAAAPAQTPDVAAGKALYAQQCAACHGASGHGDGPAGAQLDPPPIAFTDADRASQRSPLALYEAISRGVPGTSMPAYSQLTDAQRWALAFYVGGLAFSDAQRAQGEQLWKHGAPDLRAALPSLPTLVQASEQQLAQRLDPQQAQAVLAFLRAQPQALTAAAGKQAASLELARTKLRQAVDAYAQNDAKQAATLALSAYLDGVEPVEPQISARDAELLRAIETAMGKLRSDIGKGVPPAQVEADAAQALALFERADAALQGSSGSWMAAFLGSLTILLREGLEALLIVVGIIAFLRKAERREALKWVHAGWIGALVAGGLTWVVATWLIDISGANRELTEGLSSLFAAAVLLSVGIWMHQKSLAGRWQQYLNERLSAALGRGSMIFLFVLSFVAVYREVFETILFYAAMWNPRDAGAIVSGLVVGSAGLALITFALLRLGMRLPIGKFFAFSSALIAVLAVVLVGKGVAALQEAGWIGLGLVQAPRIDLLGVYPTWQTLLAQMVIAVAALLGFWINLRGGKPVPHRA